MNGDAVKALISRELGISRSTLYYHPLKPDKDWQLKCAIEEVLREHPSYGHRRLAIHLHMNKKRVRRVMRLFGIKPYRRRGNKWKKTKNIKVIYPNLLMTTCPMYENHIWCADFTYIPFQGRCVYVATVIDLYTSPSTTSSRSTSVILRDSRHSASSSSPSTRRSGSTTTPESTQH